MTSAAKAVEFVAISDTAKAAPFQRLIIVFPGSNKAC
jgi:hypothetical protein